MSEAREYPPNGAFNGEVGRVVEESVEAWPAPRRAPEGAPNVVFVVLDDVGYAQLGCYGSDIETPAFDGLAAEGLRYGNFHTTAMCSPTRASLLTGCNHHTTGMGGIADQATGFPGYHARIPKRTGFLSEILRDQGYASLAVGKWHLAPREEQGLGSTRERWPLGRGFERYYGFLGAEANQWEPDLIADNHAVEPPATPEEGYHLTEDLADQSIRMINDVRNSEPDRPFFLYFATGACHAPHQAPREWIDRYAGRFDEGWDVARERTHARQLEMGLLPEGTELSARPDWIEAWSDVEPERRALYARMMEVYAGFLSHTDHQVGRIVDHLAEIGELEDTIIVVISDNGASPEGNEHGSWNTNRWYNGEPETFES
ncbi:MAG: sulfatase-like hydrolase/transferase, partial [Actinomycetota bacterium]